jgi:hypothetical protein
MRIPFTTSRRLAILGLVAATCTVTGTAMADTATEVPAAPDAVAMSSLPPCPERTGAPEGVQAQRPEAPVAGEGVQAQRPEAPVAGEGVQAQRPEAPVAGEGVQAQRPEAPVAGEGVQAQRPEAPVAGEGVQRPMPTCIPTREQLNQRDQLGATPETNPSQGIVPTARPNDAGAEAGRPNAPQASSTISLSIG